MAQTQSPLDRRYGSAVRSVWSSVLGRMGRSWTDLRSWRGTDVRAFQRKALPVLLAGERQIATLTTSYHEQLYRDTGERVPRLSLDLDSVTGDALRGVDPADVYERPFKEVWTALSNGVPLDDAVDRGEHRLETLIKTDLQLARTHTIQALAPEFPKFEYTVRVLVGEYDCALCIVASTQRYHKRELAPIHPGCNCTIKLVTADEDPGQIIDEEKLNAIHRAVDNALGTHDRSGRAVDYRKILVANEHGEIGPVLSFNGQKFTGPDDLDDSADSESVDVVPDVVDPDPVAPQVRVSDSTRARVNAIRDALPKSREAWLADRQNVIREAYRPVDERIAQEEANLARLRTERERRVADLEAEFKRKRVPKYKRPEMLAEAVWGLDHEISTSQDDLKHFRSIAAKSPEELPAAQRYLVEEVPAITEHTYRRDTNGRLLPPEKYEQHLSNVIKVGDVLLDEMYGAFQDDEHMRSLQTRRDDMVAAGFGDDLTDWQSLLREIRQRESAIVHALLRDLREMGADIPLTEADASIRRADEHEAPATWRTLMGEALGHFPVEWLTRMEDSELHIVGTDRAYYSAATDKRPVDVMALGDENPEWYDGAFSGYAAEVATHELGHRMEQYVPGLRELEYTLVRRRSTTNGTLDAPRNIADLLPYYNASANEFVYEDHWSNPYAGKTYEAWNPTDPAAMSSEAFQVGLQDLFGRGTRRYGDTELQSFVLAVLALL